MEMYTPVLFNEHMSHGQQLNKLCRHLENIMIVWSVNYFFIDTICTGNCLLNGIDHISHIAFMAQDSCSHRVSVCHCYDIWSH